MMMKTCLWCFAIALLFCLTIPAYAIDVTFRWNANTEPDLAGYRIYYGLSSRSYNQSVGVGNQTTYTLSGLEDGEIYYFALTAFDHFGNESDFSDEVIGDFEFDNQLPIADAGPDQVVNVGDVVTLDGSKSSDPEDGIVSFKWTQLSGPAVTLADPLAVQQTFIAPDVGLEQESLTFQLDVADNGGMEVQDTCVILIQPVTLFTVYEDAEDGTTNRWHIYDDDPSGATISNVFDSDRVCRVIQLVGSGTENAYRLNLGDGSEWHNSYQFIMKWSMKFFEDFNISVDVQTTAGNRWLEYTPVDDDGLGDENHVHHGLGSDILDGQWHTFIRDLQADLQEAQPDVSIIEVNGILIRGSGWVDDIKLLKTLIWEGDYNISTEADLEALSGYRFITGSLSITNTALTDLDGLERLFHIGGYLCIDHNTALENLEGLNNLEFIGTGLWSDPQGLETYELSLCISNNDVLESLAGLDNLTHMEGGLSVWDNPALKSLQGLDNLESIEGALLISNNDNLIGLEGLKSLATIGETITQMGPLGLVIGHNDALEGLGLDSLGSVSKTFMIHDNPELCTSLAEDLRDQVIADQGIDGTINISGNNIYCDTVYEDAEDGSTAGWSIFDNTPLGATVSNVIDSDRGSRVIALSGSGAENSFRLYLEEKRWWHNSDQFVIEWSMKYSEDFTIYIYADTTAGIRWIDYTAVNYDDLGLGKHIHHGLGSDSADGQWHTFVRDLEADLQEAQPEVSIVEVNGFLIRGSGLVDDIKLLRTRIWEGDYDISTEADLEELSGYTSVTGSLSIANASLTHLNGLERLLHIDGYLYIDNNAALESLEGLNNLESIGKALWTDPGNPQNSIEMSLFVSNNAALTSLQGLDSLKSIKGGLSVWNNAALTSLRGLDNLTSIEGSLFIFNNDNLISLQDLNALTFIGETSNGVVSLGLVIGNNDALEGLGLDNLNSVSKTFLIYNNLELCTSLAEHLRDQVISGQGIGGNINISGNKACP